MGLIILAFANLSRQDAYLSVEDGGQSQFVAKVAAGHVARQASVSGQTWSIVANDSYQITAGDKNRAYIIGSTGIYEVDKVKPLTPESGAAPNDFDFPGYGGGGWP